MNVLVGRVVVFVVTVVVFVVGRVVVVFVITVVVFVVGRVVVVFVITVVVVVTGGHGAGTGAPVNNEAALSQVRPHCRLVDAAVSPVSRRAGAVTDGYLPHR